MCVICIKLSEAKKPSHKLIRKMAETNPDLCGFSYQYRHEVITHRGLTVNELIKLMREIPSDSIAVFHFRIATSGDINTLNSHPFPLFADKNKQEAHSQYSLAHNGVFFQGSDLKSDTLQTVELLEQTNPFKKGIEWLDVLCAGTHSKIALLSYKNVYELGTFTTLPEYPGLKFSNTYFKNTYQYGGYNATSGKYYSDYGDYYVDGQYNTCQICGLAPLVGKERISGICYKCVENFTCEDCGVKLSNDEIRDGICKDCASWSARKNHGLTASTVNKVVNSTSAGGESKVVMSLPPKASGSTTS